MIGECILKRNKRHTEEENEERWLITYADMITLLMVFFVVMYAIAEVKASKLNPISFALQRNFTTEPGIIPGGAAEGKYTGITEIIMQDEIADKMYEEEKREDINPLLNDLGNLLSSQLKKEKLGKAINIEVNENELTISLNTGKGFFARGSADIKGDTAQVLNTISGLCKDLPEKANIRVEGYTCNLPIQSGNYPSNWELSTARATNVARYLIEKGHIDPWRISAAGYGEYRPKVPNNSEYNRSINRRVDITIMINKSAVNGKVSISE